MDIWHIYVIYSIKDFKKQDEFGISHNCWKIASFRALLLQPGMCWREPFHWPGPWSTDGQRQRRQDSGTVDGRNLSNQLRLVVYPIVYRVLASSQVVQDFFYQQYSIKPNHLKPLQVATTCYVRQNFQKCHWNREPSPFSTLHSICGKKTALPRFGHWQRCWYVS